jgi:hypothetical protein
MALSGFKNPLISVNTNQVKNEERNTSELLEILKQQLSNSRKGASGSGDDNAFSQILMAAAHSRTTSTVDSISGSSNSHKPTLV